MVENKFPTERMFQKEISRALEKFNIGIVEG
jgi:hypothetical protein